jgi:hypothetical protein
MRKLILFIFLIIPALAGAQQLPAYGLDRVRIVQSDKVIQAEIIPVSSMPRAQNNLFYYWYGTNIIHTTEGGYSGQLLNGKYNAYYPNKNLQEQGIFKKGLKDGLWKNWDEQGTLTATYKWKSGVLQPDSTISLWKKIPFIHKKKKKDTLGVKSPSKSIKP